MSKNTPSWPRAVVFDLDGTLVDSLADLADSLNLLLAEQGLPPHDLNDVRGMVGGGVRALVACAWQAHGEPLSEAACDRLTARFLALYGPRASVKTRLYPGAEGLLDRLAQRGVALGLCTNKPERIARQILQDLHVLERFGAVIGGDSGWPKKPAPDMALGTLDQLGVAPQMALMVGDSDADCDSARAAGMPVIAVSYGYSARPARELGADTVIDRLDAADAAIDALRAVAQRGVGLV